MLIDPEVVGEKLESIDLTYREEVDETGDRLFSDFGTGELMRKVEQSVRAKHGHDVVAMCVMLNMDKTIIYVISKNSLLILVIIIMCLYYLLLLIHQFKTSKNHF